MRAPHSKATQDVIDVGRCKDIGGRLGQHHLIRPWRDACQHLQTQSLALDNAHIS